MKVVIAIILSSVITSSASATPICKCISGHTERLSSGILRTYEHVVLVYQQSNYVEVIDEFPLSFWGGSSRARKKCRKVLKDNPYCSDFD